MSVQDTELKVAILDLVSASISSQPGMMELFLCVRPRRDSDKTGKGEAAERVSPYQLRVKIACSLCPVYSKVWDNFDYRNHH